MKGHAHECLKQVCLALASDQLFRIYRKLSHKLRTASYPPCDCNVYKALQLIPPAPASLQNKAELRNTMKQAVRIGFLTCQQLYAEPLPSSNAFGCSTGRMLAEFWDMAALCLHVNYCLASVACIAS